MPDTSDVRTIIVAIKALAPVMNIEEISDVALVLLGVTQRLEKENKLNLREND